MRQLLAVHGRPTIVDVAEPPLRSNGYLVEADWSLISSGTETGLIQRSAAEQTHQPLGYSVVGRVVRAGADAASLPEGTRLCCAGFQFSPHAERISVPAMMSVPLPPRVDPRAGAFTTLGTVAIHALRQGCVQLGERVVVIGLGVVGQLLSQIARAAGARVAVADLVTSRRELALRMGAERALDPTLPAPDAMAWSDGQGADVVFLCTSGGAGLTDLACAIARDRGTIVVVGTPPLDVPRDPFFQKELQLRIARAYGPGRYDPRYEEEGIDYPFGHVRWTEGRNMAEFVRLLDRGLVDPLPLVTHHLPFTRGTEAYALASNPRSDALAILLDYESTNEGART